MIYPVYYPSFALPYWSYEPLFFPTFDSFRLISRPPLATLYDSYFSIPPLWRFPIDPILYGLNLQEMSTWGEYWINLNRSLRDAEYRMLMTASRPPLI